MLSNPLTWTLIAPLIGGVLSALFLLTQNARALPSGFMRWLRLAAFLSTAAGLVAEGILLVLASGSVTLGDLDVVLTITAPARIVLIAANVSLLCAALTAWTAEDDAHSPDHEWGLLAATLASSLLAGACLTSDRLLAALLLLGTALAVSALCVARPRMPIRKAEADDESLRTHSLLARRIAAGLKHLGLSTLGTALLVAGAVLVARYTFNLEDRELLRLGLALLATGTLVRAGGMPFATASADAIEAVPSAALIMLGAGTPVVLVTSLLMLAPVEGSLAGGAAAGWLGAIGTLLAGLRALGIILERRQRREDEVLHVRSASESKLIAMTAAASTGWALFGVLSGSHSGAVGAVLIAANMALALPILIMDRRWTPVGVASLLGLPPFGGFAGTLLVAGSAANAGGVWLLILLAGSALVAAAWLALGTTADSPERATSAPRLGPVSILPMLLVVLQLAFFLALSQLVVQLNQWASVPWLVAP